MAQTFILNLAEDLSISKRLPLVSYPNKYFLYSAFHHFFLELLTGIFSIKDASDGIGTAKALLDTIAKMESEAQKSFMHRSVKCLCLRSFAYKKIIFF